MEGCNFEIFYTFLEIGWWILRTSWNCYIMRTNDNEGGSKVTFFLSCHVKTRFKFTVMFPLYDSVFVWRTSERILTCGTTNGMDFDGKLNPWSVRTVYLCTCQFSGESVRRIFTSFCCCEMKCKIAQKIKQSAKFLRRILKIDPLSLTKQPLSRKPNPSHRVSSTVKERSHISNYSSMKMRSSSVTTTTSSKLRSASRTHVKVRHKTLHVTK